MKDSIDFGSMEIPKLFRKLLIPTVLGMVFSAVFVITDGIFVGRGIGSAGRHQHHRAAVPHQHGRRTDVRRRGVGRGVDPPCAGEGQGGAHQRHAGRCGVVAPSGGVQLPDHFLRP